MAAVPEWARDQEELDLGRRVALALVRAASQRGQKNRGMERDLRSEKNVVQAWDAAQALAEWAREDLLVFPRYQVGQEPGTVFVYRKLYVPTDVNHRYCVGVSPVLDTESVEEEKPKLTLLEWALRKSAAKNVALHQLLCKMSFLLSALALWSHSRCELLKWPVFELNQRYWAFQDGYYRPFHDDFIPYGTPQCDAQTIVGGVPYRYWPKPFPKRPNIKHVIKMMQFQRWSRATQLRYLATVGYNMQARSLPKCERQHFASFLRGRAGTGKSTFLKMENLLYPPSRVGTWTLDSASENHIYEVTVGKDHVFCDEIGKKINLTASGFKTITTGAPVTVNPKGKEQYEMTASYSISFAGNYPFPFSRDEGARRRSWEFRCDNVIGKQQMGIEMTWVKDGLDADYAVACAKSFKAMRVAYPGEQWTTHRSLQQKAYFDEEMHNEEGMAHVFLKAYFTGFNPKGNNELVGAKDYTTPPSRVLSLWKDFAEPRGVWDNMPGRDFNQIWQRVMRQVLNAQTLNVYNEKEMHMEQMVSPLMERKPPVFKADSNVLLEALEAAKNEEPPMEHGAGEEEGLPRYHWLACKED